MAARRTVIVAVATAGEESEGTMAKKNRTTTLTDPEAVRVIDSFRGAYRFLSNYADYPVTLKDGTTFKNAEAAFQSRKTLSPFQAKQFTKLLPGDAKRLGRRVTLRKDWEEVKVAEMEAVVEAKFRDPYLRGLLLDTGDAELIEGNTWNDRFWGVCDGVGENHLGKILMALRSRLREEGTTIPNEAEPHARGEGEATPPTTATEEPTP